MYSLHVNTKVDGVCGQWLGHAGAQGALPSRWLPLLRFPAALSLDGGHESSSPSKGAEVRLGKQAHRVPHA